jgi:uncharacterized protein (TIGR03437 family)
MTEFRGWDAWLGSGAAVMLLVALPGMAQVGVWETRAPYPLEATEVAAAAIGDKVYVLGGLTESGSTNRLFIYDAYTDTWQEGAPLPVAGGVDHANVAALDGKIYFLGGIRILSGFTTGETYEYDPATNTWRARASMPTPRGSSGVAALDGRIYVVGGLAAGNSIGNFEAFTPSANGWIILPPMPTPRDHLTAQAVGGKFYAIAGRRGTDFIANEEYDPVTNQWRARTPIPTARGGLGSGVIGGRIQVFGGEGSSGTPEGTFAQNQEYDPATNTWRSLAPMPTPRHGIYGATVEGRRIFVPSGGPRAGAFYSSVHEAFYLPPATPPAINAGGIVNAASFERAVAPGGLATLFGTNLSPGTQIATRFPLPTQMNATMVRVNGVPAPLIFAGPEQISFQIPFGIQPPATAVVQHAGVESAPEPLALEPAAPALFSVTKDGRGQGAILHAGGALADPANPASVGEAIEIYGTGLGDLRARDERTIPIVTIGGRAAEILFFGAAPGFVGLYQLNVRVPTGVAPGPTVPVRLSYLNRTSNEVTIAVR